MTRMPSNPNHYTLLPLRRLLNLPTAHEHQMEVSLPVWMTASSSKEHPPMQTHLKWCGCLVSSRCTHSRLESLAPHTLISSSSSNDWMSSPLLSPDGTQRYYQTGTRNGAASSLIGDHKRDTFVEPFRFDDLQIAKYKAQILAHPMYEQMLAAHVGCLRVATPIDYLQTIEAQLSAERQYMQGSRYSKLHDNNRAIVSEEKEQLDRFMTAYIMLLHLFKQQLQEHVHEHAREAVASCWEIEQALLRLTGVSPGEGSGSTMSDDDEETMRAEASLSYHDQEFFEEGDMLGLGPLMPTESERSLMQRVRQELKSEFKQGYKKRIADVREEILRKRRAGKLPSETTAILKKWWNAHSKWPYPTEDEKAQLVHETGLELKQINNWFINQRKRNWHGHPLTSSSLAKNDSSTSIEGIE